MGGKVRGYKWQYLWRLGEWQFYITWYRHIWHIYIYRIASPILSMLTVVTFRGKKKSLQVNALIAIFFFLQQINRTEANIGSDKHFYSKSAWWMVSCMSYSAKFSILHKENIFNQAVEVTGLNLSLHSSNIVTTSLCGIEFDFAKSDFLCTWLYIFLRGTKWCNNLENIIKWKK